MCDPVTIGLTTAAVGAGSAIIGFAGESAAAKSQRNAIRQNYAGDYNAIADRNVQESQAKSEDHFQAFVESLKAQGRVSASAGALGIGAQTATQITRGATQEINYDQSIGDLNSRARVQANLSELQGARRSAASKLAAAQGPTPGELVLGLAKAGLKGVSAYSSAGGKF